MTEPNDQMGSVENPPWAGLWVDPDVGENELAYGIIVIIQPDAVVTLFTHDTEDSVREAWASLEKTIEVKTPKPYDFVVWEHEVQVNKPYRVFRSGHAHNSPPEYDFQADSVEKVLRWIIIAHDSNPDHIPDVWLREEDADGDVTFKLLQTEI